MSDYTEHWPGEGGSASFFALTDSAVNRYKDGDAPPPPSKIRSEMAGLRSAINKLSSEAREEIDSRELDQWQKARPPETWFDDKYRNKRGILENNGSALSLLEKSVAEDFKREEHRDAVKRKSLIASAAFVFTTHGGAIEERGNSPFVKYIQHLFIDVGMEQADCQKAVRDFIAKNSGVLD